MQKGSGDNLITALMIILGFITVVFFGFFKELVIKNNR